MGKIMFKDIPFSGGINDNIEIVTSLDDSVTDEQVSSAKAVYDNIVDKNVKTYCLFSQLGLSSGCSVSDIFNAMPIGSIGRFDYNGSTITGMPTINGGVLIIDKCNAYRFSIIFKESAYGSVASNIMYIGQLKGSDGTGLTWDRVCTTTVADVAKTHITFANTTNYNIENYDYSWFMVKNGICYYSLYVKAVSPVDASFADVGANSLPTPMAGNHHFSTCNRIGATVTSQIVGTIYNNTLSLAYGATDETYLITGSYPVAE